MTLEIGTILIWLVCSGADVSVLGGFSQCIAAIQEKYPNCEIGNVDLNPILMGPNKIEVRLRCAELPSVVEPDER